VADHPGVIEWWPESKCRARRLEERIGRRFVGASAIWNGDCSSLLQGAESTPHLDSNATRRTERAAFERANLEVLPFDVHLRPRQSEDLNHNPEFEGTKTVANKNSYTAVVAGSMKMSPFSAPFFWAPKSEGCCFQCERLHYGREPNRGGGVLRAEPGKQKTRSCRTQEPEAVAQEKQRQKKATYRTQ